jgi:hypothetical protein
VNRVRSLSPPVRLLLAAVLALCLGERLLAPPGFMPSFAAGRLAIVECPDAYGSPMPPMADMPGMAMAGTDTPVAAPPGHARHGGKDAFHQLCPYAQAASLAVIDLGAVALAVAVLAAALAPLARALPAISRRATRDRPPAQGPPFPA